MNLKEEIQRMAKKYFINFYGNMAEFKDSVNWYRISAYQNLSEDFIREFKDNVNWDCISTYQNLSEDFIREFKDSVNWYYISAHQNLSEDFIREFKDKVDWYCISEYQNLSEDFIREFKDRDLSVAREINKLHKNLDPIKNSMKYAKKHSLEINNKYLYAFRNHDRYGRGSFNKTISYEKGIYYRDWHCDPRKEIQNSFGFGIWPKGNTKVRIKRKDFCIEVDKNDGKARVWGFKVI